MRREEYKNIPIDYVVKQAFAWLLVVVGWIGIILGVCIHYFGVEEGLYWGLQFSSVMIAFDVRAFGKFAYRRSVVVLCLAVAALSILGALRLHQYYLLFGACLLVGIAILVAVLKPKVSTPVAEAGRKDPEPGNR